MIRIRDFTPSEDVLNAIRSLRANDDGVERLDRAAETPEQSATAETPRHAGSAVTPKYGLHTTGRYLRVKV